MNKPDIEDIYDLSPLQQGILYHCLIAPNSGLYCIRLHYVLRGRLDVSTFARAWQHVIDRHPILRTSFHWEELEKPVQVVHGGVELAVQFDDWRCLSSEEQEAQLGSYIREEGPRGFALGAAPLMRLRLIRAADEIHHLLWSFHHMILDGWSKSVVLNEAIHVYHALRQRRPIDLKPARSFREYVLWLRNQDMDAAEAFWREDLEGWSSPTELDIERPTPRAPVYEKHQLRLSRDLSTSLRDLARAQRVTMNTLIQGAWAILLSRYGGGDDVVFGMTVACRPPESDNSEVTVGVFINTLPVRVQVPPTASLRSWLAELQIHQSTVRQHDHSPLSEVQKWSSAPGGSSLFDSLLVYENFPEDPILDYPAEIEAQLVDGLDWSNYGLTVEILPGDELSFIILYDSNRFERDAVARLLDHLSNILESMVTATHGRLLDISMISDVERRRILTEWTYPDVMRDPLPCVHQLFAAQVERTPDSIAIRAGDTRLTYRELNERANQLAHHLCTRGVGPDVLVGLMTTRSVEMLVGLLGILKAGGAYVPLDPEHPQSRLALILADTQMRVLLTQESLTANLPPHDTNVIFLDTESTRSDLLPKLNPVTETSGDHLAYVIYTSGSTGKPKGTMIRHGGLANYLAWCSREFPLGAGCGAPVHTSIAFDLTITGLLPPLLVGAQVTLAPESFGVEGLWEVMQERSDFSLVKLTPTHLEMLSEAVPTESAAGLTRAFVIGGEALLPEHIEYWRRASPQTRLINHYGPTEAVVGCCVYEIPDTLPDSVTIPIGRSIENTQAYVLDPELRPVPAGVIGELYIGGVGLARGYLNRPGLTAERFIPHPFSNDPGARLYRTGDLARHLDDGNIEYMGRADDQVKFRGYRIELGEIEAVLARHADIRSAAVVLREDAPGVKRLVAYYMPRGGVDPDPQDLRRFVQADVPDYMVPSLFVAVEDFPLTANGKVDRQRLPPPERDRTEPSVAPDAPATEMELLIADIWEDVLQVRSIGLNDNFFDLGGHSLLSVRVTTRLEERVGLRVSPREMIYQTLGQFAAGCERCMKTPVSEESENLSRRMVRAFRGALDQIAAGRQ